MSEQRRIRSELKQGLHQYLMGMYMSYSENHGQDEAKQLVSQVMEEEYQYFSSTGLKTTSAQDVLTEKMEELTDKMESVGGDYDTQLWYAEKLDTLSAARAIIEEKIS